MARITIDTGKVIHNITTLNEVFKKYNYPWTPVLKMVSGHEDVLEHVLKHDAMQEVHSVADSRLSSIRRMKDINPELRTMYIKPPAIEHKEEVVKYVDISLNTSYTTIVELNEEADRQNKVHDIIIMIEMGELREGVLRGQVTEFYEKVFEMPNINVLGIGSNLGCMVGIEPTFDKMMQMALYQAVIEAKFEQKMALVSDGTSITLPLLGERRLPDINHHFRIGEAVFLGTSPLYAKQFENLKTGAFRYYGSIIELEEKDNEPEGIIGDANIGEVYPNPDMSYSHKAIVDFGVLDVNAGELSPVDKSVRYFGTTSDMTVYDLGKNKDADGKPKYKIGDRIEFDPSYIAIARIMNSRFIEKEVY